MDASKALIQYVRLRHRREELAKLPKDAKGIVHEVFTAAELQQLKVCETELNRLRGADTIELLIRYKSNVIGFIR